MLNVAVQLSLFVPVCLNCVNESLVLLLEGAGIRRVAKECSNLGGDTRGHDHPAGEVEVQLIIAWESATRIVVEARAERVVLCPSPPAEGVLGNACLRPHIPLAPLLETRESVGEEATVALEHHRFICSFVRAAGGHSLRELLSASEGSLQCKKESRRVGVVPVLRHELPGHPAPRLVAEDLFAREPAVARQEVHPVADDVHGELWVPLSNEQLVESLIPEESSREECPRRHSAEEASGREEAGLPVLSFVKERVTTPESDAAQHVAERELGGLLEQSAVTQAFVDGKSRPEPLLERTLTLPQPLFESCASVLVQHTLYICHGHPSPPLRVCLVRNERNVHIVA
mmetsp:Transcript_12132/g.48808  ORF Transcript_12132/g.48808 Transcript_12132/m.48808 type:complete len:344 (-) Transcript_12132:586-1617(-)